jgi:hypothetical protein
MLAIFCAISVAQDDNRTREELTDQEVLELHDVDAKVRDSLEARDRVRMQIRKAHGECEQVYVELDDGYVVKYPRGEN